MMPLEALAMDMQKDPENWEIPFMDFMDDFRRYPTSPGIANPANSINEKFDALIASMVEYL